MQPYSMDSAYSAPLRPNNAPLFLANPKNRAFVEGTKTRIGNSAIILLLALIAFGVAGFIAWQFGRPVLYYDQLITGGKVADARIVDGYTSTSSRSRTVSYYVTYRFIVEGESYERQQQITSSHYNDLGIGSRVQVAYLADDPSISTLTGEYASTVQRDNDLGLTVFIGGAALIIGIILVVADAKNRRLSHQGQFLDGVLVSATGKPGSKGAYNVTLTYQFVNPMGVRMEKKVTVDRRDLRNHLPQPGTPVKIRYVNDRSLRLM